IGFEATAIFSEEAKDPERTVPRATYAAVCAIGIFYALTAWVLVGAYGADQVHAVAAKDPGLFVFNAMRTFVGEPAVAILALLLITSLFAALLATHGATARYFFALGREGLLPRALGRTHPKWRSPHIASGAQIAVTAVVVLPFAITNADPLLTLTTSTGGLGTLGIIALQGATAFSVVAYFRQRRDRRWLITLIAPAIGGIGLAVALVLIVRNYATLTGSRSPIINELPWLLVISAVAGFGYAAWLRRARPDVYAGTSAPEGAAE
ncbi:MAG TPA: APC family permease, partial [Polyangiaceae bacterium]|nr:APC family permease [Polyangiaceae bacterium]